MILLMQYTLIFASVLILVALGGCFSEHSGVINLGLEGIMISNLPTDYWGRIGYLLTHYGQSFLRGAGITIAIALVGTAVGCIIGFLVGIVQTIPVTKKDSWPKRALLWLVRLILNIYVEVFRGTPMMVQAMGMLTSKIRSCILRFSADFIMAAATAFS